MVFRAILLFLGSLALSACNPVAVMNDTESEIEAFHKSWSQEDWDTIWKETAPEFKQAVTREQLFAMLGEFRQIFGEVKSTERESFNIGSTNGITTKTVVMVTQYANGEGRETYIFVSRDEGMQLLNYDVRSDMLLDYDWSKLKDKGFKVEGGEDAPAPEAEK